MANIVVCCDGTWNSADNRDDGRPAPTNVRKFFAEVAKPAGPDNQNLEQFSYYGSGVGTSGGVFKRVLGGAIGFGLEDDIKSAYKFLAETYRSDDDRIFLLGFSRGAYTARSLAGMIGRLGLLDMTDKDLTEKEKWDATHAALIRYQSEKTDGDLGMMQRHFWLRQPQGDFSGLSVRHADIHFLGVWDTVGSLGVPDDLGLLKGLIGDPRKHRFHDTKLGAIVQNARHAVAIDERRLDFTPTLWTEANKDRVKQVWFPGVHGDVGGSYSDHDLGDITLRWMMIEAETLGLVFRSDPKKLLKNNPQGQLHNSVSGVFRFRRTRPRSVPSFVQKTDQMSRLSPQAVARNKRPASGEVEYWPCRHLSLNASVTVQVRAQDRWNRTGIFVKKGEEYRLAATGEWLDASIVASPDGANPGFHPGKAAYFAAAAPEAYRALLRKFKKTRNADNSFSRRVQDAPWFALIGAISNGKGIDSGTQVLDTHQYFKIGTQAALTPDDDGFLYAFANDAWAAYGNNAGRISLTVERVS